MTIICLKIKQAQKEESKNIFHVNHVKEKNSIPWIQNNLKQKTKRRHLLYKKFKKINDPKFKEENTSTLLKKQTQQELRREY